MKNSQKGSTTVVLLIIIVLLVLGFGYYIYQQNMSSSQPKVDETATKPDATPTQTTSQPKPSTNTSSAVPKVTGVTSGKYTKFLNTVVIGEGGDIITGQNFNTVTSVYIVPVTGGSKINLSFKKANATSFSVDFLANGLMAGKYNLYVVNSYGTSVAHQITVVAD
jgi:hypothetical protein